MRLTDRKQHRESGQATLEFILVLFVGVIIALGLLYRFNTAFKAYTVGMYGTYYRCLLETGELPGVGSVCKDKQSRFDIANGRELLRNVPGSDSGSGGSGSSGSGSSGGGGSPSKSGSSTTKTPNGSSGSTSGSTAGKNSGSRGGSEGSGGSNGSGPESVGSGSRGSGGGSSSSVGRLRNSGRSRSTSMGNASGGSADGDGADKPEPLSTYSASGSRSDNDALRRSRTKMDFKMDGGEYQRAETAAVTAVSASSMKNADKSGSSLRPRKAVEPENRKPASKPDDSKEGGFEFGRIFRLFMIFGIIVAILVFLGGQVLQISKSGEK